MSSYQTFTRYQTLQTIANLQKIFLNTFHSFKHMKLFSNQCVKGSRFISLRLPEKIRKSSRSLGSNALRLARRTFLSFAFSNMIYFINLSLMFLYFYFFLFSFLTLKVMCSNVQLMFIQGSENLIIAIQSYFYNEEHKVHAFFYKQLSC